MDDELYNHPDDKIAMLPVQIQSREISRVWFGFFFVANLFQLEGCVE